MSTPFVPMVQAFWICSGTSELEKFNKRVLRLLVGASMVRLLTVWDAGKFATVDGNTPTALNPALVIDTDWLLPGKMPSDQYGSSHLALAGFVQLLIWQSA